MAGLKFPSRIEDWTLRDHLMASVHFTLSQSLTPTARKHVNAVHVAGKIVDHLLISGFHIEKKPPNKAHSSSCSADRLSTVTPSGLRP